MQKNRPKSIRISLLWIVLLLLLIAVSWFGLQTPQHLWVSAPGWSRARLIGTTELREPAPIVLDNDGNNYVLLFSDDSSSIRPEILALNAQGETLWREAVATSLDAASEPTMVFRDDNIYLFWLSDQQLFKAALDIDGNTTSPAAEIPFPIAIDHYSIAFSSQGLHVWVSSDFSNPALYQKVNEDEPILVDATGYTPQLRVDSTDELHAVWQRQLSRDITSVVFALPEAQETIEPVTLTEINTSGSRIRGPWFAVEEKTGYLSWTIDIVQGPQAGRSFSKYISFPLEANTVALAPLDFDIPYARQREYTVADTILDSGARAEIDPARGRKAAPLEAFALNPAQNQGGESVMALRVTLEYLKRRSASQVALYYWRDGQNSGYQLISFSPGASMLPSIGQRSNGDLALTWLESDDSGSYSVYLTTTDPELTQAFSQLQLQDYGLFVVDSLFGMVQSVTFAPFSFVIWSALPFLLLLVTAFWHTKNPSWSSSSFIIILALAILGFWVGKYITLGEAMASYVPFSAWIPIIPAWLELPMRLLVPLIISVFSLYAAWRISNRRQTPSLFLVFLIFALLDTVITMSIYGGALYNAF